MKKTGEQRIILTVVLIVCLFLGITVFAAREGDVAGEIEGTWRRHRGKSRLWSIR